jgi:deazaflavin-dependent oxidoreductase (nitroreductase family)
MSDYAYLTTTGRNSGQPRTIEIWFGEVDGQLYLLSGGGDRSDWVKNLKNDPAVRIRLGGPRERDPDLEGTVAATARIVDDGDEDARARRLLDAKYHGWTKGEELSRWAQTALPIAIDRQRPAG